MNTPNSDTPETDSAASRDYAPLSVPYDFARQLERERDQLRVVCDEQQKVISIARNAAASCLREAGLSMTATELRWHCDKAIELYNQLQHVQNK